MLEIRFDSRLALKAILSVIVSSYYLVIVKLISIFNGYISFAFQVSWASAFVVWEMLHGCQVRCHVLGGGELVNYLPFDFMQRNFHLLIMSEVLFEQQAALA